MEETLFNLLIRAAGIYAMSILIEVWTDLSYLQSVTIALLIFCFVGISAGLDELRKQNRR